MSSRTIDILFSVPNQSLIFDCPEGRPSAIAASEIFETATGDDGTEESATSGSASIDATPNTTFDATSGDGQTDPTICNLTATTGCTVGRTYQVTTAQGRKERVEVVAISSGAYVVVREPLQNSYAIADAFVSTRVSQGLSSVWIQNTNNLSGEFDPNPRYRWRLRYSVSSVEYIHDLYFDLVRYAARHDVTGIDVERRFAGWLRATGTYERADQGSSVIAEAFEHVKFDLYNLDTPDQSIRNREVVNELVKLASGAMVFNTPEYWKLYQDRLSQLIAFAKTSVQTSDNGASVRVDARPIWRR